MKVIDKMSNYLIEKCNLIDNSEWFITATHNLEFIHWSLVRRCKFIKVMFSGKGKMMRKFILINSLYHKNDINGIMTIKDKLLDKNRIRNIYYTKYNELINYCLFLEEFKDADSSRATELTNYLIDLVDKRRELGSLIAEKARLMNSEKQATNLRRSQRWLTRHNLSNRLF